MADVGVLCPGWYRRSHHHINHVHVEFFQMSSFLSTINLTRRDAVQRLTVSHRCAEEATQVFKQCHWKCLPQLRSLRLDIPLTDDIGVHANNFRPSPYTFHVDEHTKRKWLFTKMALREVSQVEELQIFLPREPSRRLRTAMDSGERRINAVWRERSRRLIRRLRNETMLRSTVSCREAEVNFESKNV